MNGWRSPVLTAICRCRAALTGGMSTSSSSTTWSNAPSKKRSAACITSLYCRRAARAWAGVAPLYRGESNEFLKKKHRTYHFHELLHLTIHV